MRLRDRLKKIGGRTDFECDDYRSTVKFLHRPPRNLGAVGRGGLLGKVVERLNTDVKTQSLKGVIVDDEDYKTVFWAMKRISERSGHDMDSRIRMLPLQTRQSDGIELPRKPRMN